MIQNSLVLGRKVYYNFLNRRLAEHSQVQSVCAFRTDALPGDQRLYLDPNTRPRIAEGNQRPLGELQKDAQPDEV